MLDFGAGTTHITPITKARIDHQGRNKLPKYLRYRYANRQYLHRGSLYTSVNQICNGIDNKYGSYPFTPRACRMVVVASLLKYVHPEIAREHDFPLLEEKDARILLARAVGMDIKSMTDRELLTLAQGIYSELSSQVGTAFRGVLDSPKGLANRMELVTTGLSGKPVMETAFARDQGLRERLIHLEDKLPHRLHEASTAYGIALYAMDRLMDTSLPPDRVEVMP